MRLTGYVYSLEAREWSNVKASLQEKYDLEADSLIFSFVPSEESTPNPITIGDAEKPPMRKSPEILSHLSVDDLEKEDIYEDSEFWEDFFRQKSLFRFKDILSYLLANSGSSEDQVVRAIQDEFSEIREELSRSVQSAVNTTNNDIEQKLQPILEELQKITHADAANEVLHSDEFRDLCQKADQVISYLEEMREQHAENALDSGSQQSELNQEIEKWRSKTERTRDKLDQTKNQYQQLKESYEKLYSKHEKILKKYRDAKEKIRKAGELQRLLEREQDKNRELKEEIERLNRARSEEKSNSSHEFMSDESEHESTESLALEDTGLHREPNENLEVAENELSNRDEKEKSILTGEYFEIGNDQKWYVRNFDQKGPYRLTEMLQFKEDDDINLDSLVRDENKGVWRRVTDFVELCAPLHVEKEKGEKGEVRERYFIKRSSYRVPFYEVVSLEIGDEVIRGYCTSLSLGGCFVELSKLNENLIEKGARGIVSFQEGALGGEFSCEIEIMNIHQRKPRGVGLMFHGLSSLGMKFIGEYVEQHFLRKNRAA